MSGVHQAKFDIVTIGAVSGIVGVFVKDILELVVLLFIPSLKTCPRLAAGIVFPPNKVMGSSLPIVGLEVDIAVSIVVGMIVAAVLLNIGFERLIFKGIIAGLLAWTIIDITLSKLLSQLPPPDSVAQVEVSLLIHFIYGLTLVFTVWILDKKQS